MIFRRKPRRPNYGGYAPALQRRRRATPSKPSGTGALPKLRRRRISFFDRRKKTAGKTLAPVHEFTPTKKRKPVTGFWGKLKRWLIVAALLGLAGFIIYNLFLSHRLDLRTVTVFEDEEPLPDHPLVQILGEFKGTNVLLLNTSKIESFLATKYPHYARIRLHKNLPDTLSVSLETHPLVAHLYVKTDDERTSFVLNAAGMAQNTDETLENTERPVIVVEREASVKEGEKIISPEELGFILEAMQNFEDKFGMKVAHTLFLAIPREAHLYTERKFYVWLDLMMDLDEQLDKLKNALPRLNIYEEPLNYIDLRISGVSGEKIIFKKD